MLFQAKTIFTSRGLKSCLLVFFRLVLLSYLPTLTTTNIKIDCGFSNFQIKILTLLILKYSSQSFSLLTF